MKTPENLPDTSTGSGGRDGPCFLCLLEAPISQSRRVLPVDMMRTTLEQPGQSLCSAEPSR